MDERLTYLVLEMAWALPPIVLQWLVGRQFLRQHRAAWWFGIAIPTLYLVLADSTALGTVWTINPAKSLGIAFGNVPLEEVIFFLLTNTLVVQTIVLAFHIRELRAQVLPRLLGLVQYRRE